MSDEKVKIRLKDGFPEPIETQEGEIVQPQRMELSYGSKSVALEVGQAVEVPLKELQMWLNTGKVEQVIEDTDLPEGLPGRDAFINAGMDFESVKNFDFENNKVFGIGAKTIEALKAFLANGGNQ